MIDIKDIKPGQSYACKFKIKTMVDSLGRPAPNLSDQPLAGIKMYEGLGLLLTRDSKQELVELRDEKSGKVFVCPYDDIWDIDDAEFIEPAIK